MNNVVHMSVTRAKFVADGLADAEVRVLVDPTNQYGPTYSIDFGGPEDIVAGSAPVGRELQLAESLQFVADTVGATIPGRLSPFVRGWISTAADVHHTAREKGFWVDGVDRNDGEMLALVHSEVSEVLEALRKGNPPDDKLPEFLSTETELADVVIRIMDLGHARGWRVAQAVEAKMKYNATRPHKHGKEF